MFLKDIAYPHQGSIYDFDQKYCKNSNIVK